MRIGIASSTEPFLSIFRRYFCAAGFEVILIKNSEAASNAMNMGRVNLLVVDSAVMDRNGDDWSAVGALAEALSVPVLAAGPIEMADTVREKTRVWAKQIITYPMNPETARQTILAVLGMHDRGLGDPATGISSENAVTSSLTAVTAASVVGSPTVQMPAPCTRSASYFLRASQMIFDQVTDAIFVFTPDAKMITMVNKAGVRMLGYERKELVGRTADIVFSQLRNPPEINGLDLGKAISRFAMPPFDTSLRTASGRLIEVNFSTSFLRDEEGSTVGVLGIAREIRERRQLEERLQRHNELLEEEVQARTVEIRASEARYRSLLEQIPIAVVCTSIEGRVMSFNRAAGRLFKWDDRVLGSDCCEAWECQRHMACREVLRSEGIWAGECVMSCERGTESYMSHTTAPVQDDAGHTSCVLHVLSDLSSPLAAERELMRDARGTAICDRDGFRQIITCSKKMERVLDLVAMYAESSATVLIEGETGTGKDLVAQALHLNSGRAHRPFVVINCAALEKHFLRSELFGYERGAFTGADRKREGLLEVADGGTVFIDEIGDMNLEVQAVVLRVIETGRFRRLGSTCERQTDVRIIAATNKDLKQEVAHGRFREDLFYRLNVVHIGLPSLRERKEDIPLLVAHFLQRPSEARLAMRPKRCSEAAMEILMAHDWPGNVRELENVIEQARILSNGKSTITLACLSHSLIEKGQARLCQPQADERSSDKSVHHVSGITEVETLSLAQIEKLQIRKVLRAMNGNRTKAALRLGISRVTLRKKMRKYEL